MFFSLQTALHCMHCTLLAVVASTFKQIPSVFRDVNGDNAPR
jgi:hypothetical protein